MKVVPLCLCEAIRWQTPRRPLRVSQWQIEPGETPEQCLKRELNEEFTIESEIGEFVAESIFDYGNKHTRLLAYKVKHLSGEF